MCTVNYSLKIILSLNSKRTRIQVRLFDNIAEAFVKMPDLTNCLEHTGSNSNDTCFLGALSYSDLNRIGLRSPSERSSSALIVLRTYKH